MNLEFDPEQILAFNNLKAGSILCGGVGSGKSRVALLYYFVKECDGQIKINGVGDFGLMKKPKDLYIITTARKRDTFEWEKELGPLRLSTNQNINPFKTKVIIDSWNNIDKYTKIKNAFFIFDEQRVIGSGLWVKSFISIAKENRWILLSATPGDTWLDYIPVFVANGFYKNRTEFLRRHVVYKPFSKYPKVDRYVEVGRLERFRQQIIVNLKYIKPATSHKKIINVSFNKELFETVTIKRWNIFKNKPIKTISEMFYLMRKVVNSDPSRIDAVRELIKQESKLIIFYNFDYELELLKELGKEFSRPTAEWNGHKHEVIPKEDSWIYLIQYAAGAEGWNCIETNCALFYSQNYSFKTMVQAAGRIDRRNTPYSDLYYFHIRSNSAIDLGITRALEKKKNFNERKFIKNI